MSFEHGMGVSLETVVEFLEKFGPKFLAEEWDNTGLLIEPYTKQNVTNILLTNDLTEDVMAEALQVKANLIISYHPPIFSSLKQITNSSWKGRIIAACLENKIAVYSPHTIWDSVPGGVNDWLASAFVLDVNYITPIVPSKHLTFENAGAGRYCQLKENMPLIQAVNNIKQLIGQPHVQIALARGLTLEDKIKDVAICAGKGSSVLNNHPAQLYVTGEMLHHELLQAIHNGSSVILCNHSNSERGFLKHFQKKLEEHFINEKVKALISKCDRDPLQFS
ncbi:UNVERIFIED_CONTAM: hypothetical protein PYX00_003204 [Menopon gallinae]|uniref:NIF3-like protein 1 n=1 Tax=Menopon gallinae TaxID=328185 RepID=A0AAW2I113_9NEOP